MYNWTTEFEEWMKKKSKHYHRFNELASIFENFITEYVLVSKNDSDAVAERFQDMTGNCNIPNIYDNSKAVEAYAILHFLNRFYRFQLIYFELIRLNLLPIENYIKYLDIGTGPAPAIFALSDIINFIKEFAEDKEEYSYLMELELLPDYVENSESFRNWLHRFTEYANCKAYNGKWNVPYHHGSFNDFKELNFKKLNYNKKEWERERIYNQFGSDERYLIVEKNNEINVYAKNFMYGHIFDRRKNAHRYNIISFSFFLTTLETVENYLSQIKGCAFSLRNNGIIVNIGSSDSRFKPIYERIKETVESLGSKNIQYEIGCKEVLRKEISYSDNDMFIKRVRQSYEFFLSKISMFQSTGKIEPKILQKLKSYINLELTKIDKKFIIQIFQKRIVPMKT